jgi:hypothetical protein
MDTQRAIYKEEALGRTYDPLRVHRRLLLASGFEVNEWLADHDSDDLEKRVRADEKLLPLIRDAFDLGEFRGDDYGVLDSECFAVLERFNEYLQGKGERE